MKLSTVGLYALRRLILTIFSILVNTNVLAQQNIKPDTQLPEFDNSIQRMATCESKMNGETAKDKSFAGRFNGKSCQEILSEVNTSGPADTGAPRRVSGAEARQFATIVSEQASNSINETSDKILLRRPRFKDSAAPTNQAHRPIKMP